MGLGFGEGGGGRLVYVGVKGESMRGKIGIERQGITSPPY